MIIAELAGIITEQRLKRGLSENALAKVSGLSQSMVTRLKKDDANPSLDSLLRIADALELNLAKALALAIRKAERVATASRPEKA